ncbi:MAG TPA: anthranilate phosphoribosyltransferase [Chloroflexota bacterium]|nr:anthranilate phosphoribosyltransferase [Chloroflexota bacterium]
MSIRQAIALLVEGQALTEEQAAAAMQELVDGTATPAQIGAFATALRMKGETAEELAGLVRVMRGALIPVEVDGSVVDTAGTGGDGACTFNISTVAAIVAAGAGARVAKHGNRAASSACGSADLLEGMGVVIDLPPAGVAECVATIGIGFMYAPLFHPALRHAVGPRRELGIRTVFNLLGPLLNPARAQAQILGVSVPEMAGTMAEVLRRTGSRHALVVYGEDGVDELSLSAPSVVHEVVDGTVRRYTVSPEDVGLGRAPREVLMTDSVAASAARAQAVLGGEHGPARDVVLLNAAGTLLAADLVADLREGIGVAAESIDSGAAASRLDALRALTQELKARAEGVPA